MGYLNKLGFRGRPLVLGTTIDTYVKHNQLENFIANKCQHFEQTERTLCIIMVQYNALKGFPSIPC